MRRTALAAVAVSTVVALLLATRPADAQVPITSSTTSTTRRPTSTSTTKPPSTTTTAKPATTTTRRPTTTASTAPPRTTSTIATPAPAAPTTEPPQPLSKHSGDFSPVFTWLTVLGLVAALGLLGLQWFLTRPGRQGWTL